MARSREDIRLPVSWDIIDACSGFSFDMGGSVMKLVYIDKQDWVTPTQRRPGSKGCVHLTNFSRLQLDEAFDFISKRVRFNRKNDSESISIFTTGFGGSQYSDDLKQKLNVINTNLDEMICFNQGFMHVLKNYPRRDVLHPVYEPAFELVQKEIDYYFKLFGGLKDVTQAVNIERSKDDITFPQLKAVNQNKPLTDDKDCFPCGIMMCGSGIGLSVINSDGSSALVGTSSRGGKMFLGLGSLLTKAKNYDELMDLCAKGEANKVSVTNLSIMKDLAMKSTGEDDVYGKFAESADYTVDTTVFSFGQADGKTIEDFKREDLARCLLETHCSDLINMAHDGAAVHGLKHVFMCGGFPNHPLAREIITYEWLRKDSAMSLFNARAKTGIQCHFMVHGQSLGALGAMVNNKLEWSKGKHPPSNENTGKPGDRGYKQAIGL